MRMQADYKEPTMWWLFESEGAGGWKGSFAILVDVIQVAWARCISFFIVHEEQDNSGVNIKRDISKIRNTVQRCPHVRRNVIYSPKKYGLIVYSNKAMKACSMYIITIAP